MDDDYVTFIPRSGCTKFMKGDERPQLVLASPLDALYFLEKGVAVMKGNPDKRAVFESPDKSALTRQVVTMACEVRARDGTDCAMSIDWRWATFQYT